MRVLTPVLVAAALLLSACGTTETPAAAPSESTGGPVKVTDSRGKAIELKAPAKRVVVLEWGEAEMVVSLGVMPVGVADTAGYKIWDTAAALTPDVKDVGKRGEPSVDAIVGLNPEVVIVAEERDSALVPQLEKYVPVVVTKGSEASRNFDRLRDDFKMIAKTLGKEAEADKQLSEMDTKLADAEKAVEAKGATGTPFLMADGWKEGSTVSIRPFAKGSLVSDIAEAIGLKNVWTGKGDEQWGLGQTDVEGLTAITDPKAILVYNASEEDVFTDGLAQNPVWQRLPFVVSKKITKMTPGVWMFGGPKSVVAVADQFVKAVNA